MTTKPKPVTLFGRRYVVGEASVTIGGRNLDVRAVVINGTHYFPTKLDRFFGILSDAFHLGRRALERKIESQWKRLGKLMGKEGKK